MNKRNQKLIQKSVSLESLEQDYLDDDLIKDINSQIFVKDFKQKGEKLPLYTFDSIGIAIVSAGQSLYSHWVSLAKLSDSYRAHYTMKQVWHSAFAIHNETVSLNHSNQQGNIWTHLFAFFVFIGLSIFTGTIEWHPAESAIDKAVMTIFTLSASYTFLSSSLFHLHICHSQKLYSIFVCLDYTGISALIAGSSIALIYLLFYCQPVARNVWCSLIVLVNAAGVCGTMFRGCLGPRYRSVRTSIFVMSSVLIFLPVIHFAVTKGIDGFPDPSTNFAGVGFLLMVLFYVLGVCIYIFKVPERFYPGKYDFIMHSHQIWHILVLLGAISHYLAVTSLLTWTLNHATCLKSI